MSILRLFGMAADETAGENPRSPQWAALDKRLKKLWPKCAACGQPTQVIHHVIPFSEDPSKELDPNNCMPGCNRCHLLIYHLDFFQSVNVNARDDAAKLLAKIEARP